MAWKRTPLDGNPRRQVPWEMGIRGVVHAGTVDGPGGPECGRSLQVPWEIVPVPKAPPSPARAV